MEGSNYFKQFNIHDKVAFKPLEHQQWLKANVVGLKALKEHTKKPNVVAAARGNSKISALLAWECTRIVELCTQNPKFAQKYDDCIHDTFVKCVLF